MGESTKSKTKCVCLVVDNIDVKTDYILRRKIHNINFLCTWVYFSCKD